MKLKFVSLRRIHKCHVRRKICGSAVLPIISLLIIIEILKEKEEDRTLTNDTCLAIKTYQKYCFCVELLEVCSL